MDSKKHKNNIGYKNLKKAIQNSELELYLIGNHKYRINSIYGADVMADFWDITYNLNVYGQDHPGFDKFLNEKMIQILGDNKIFYTYAVANIIKEQTELECQNRNKINFLNQQLLEKLKFAINSQKEQLVKFYDYEASLYSNGLLGA